MSAPTNRTEPKGRGALDDFGRAKATGTLALLWFILSVGVGVDSVRAAAAADRVGFERLAPQVTGVAFTNRLELDRQLLSQILPNGSGVAAGDVDGDGWVDLYFCGLDSENRLYRNLGDWRFEDITAAAGVGWPGKDATGAAFADLDGDGDLDLVVNSIGGGTAIFLNDGRGRFTETGQGFNAGRGGTSLALGDLDGDGDIDLYVANYRASTYADRPQTRFTVRRINDQFTVTMVDGRPLTDPDLTNRFNFTFVLEGAGRGRLAHEENGEPDLILFNDGQGRFEVGSFTGGRFMDADGRALREPPYDWGLAVAVRDINGDDVIRLSPRPRGRGNIAERNVWLFGRSRPHSPRAGKRPVPVVPTDGAGECLLDEQEKVVEATGMLRMERLVQLPETEGLDEDLKAPDVRGLLREMGNEVAAAHGPDGQHAH